MLETYLELLDLGYYEATFAFEGLADKHVWKRPTEGLLSVGELAAHIAYGEVIHLASGSCHGDENTSGFGEHLRPNLDHCRIKSLLIDHQFAYYPNTLALPPSEQHRAMTAEDVSRELARVHQETIAAFKELNPDLESAPPGHAPDHTYREWLKYLVFHIAYHTGQMYSVRHLLGEQTPDN